MTCAARLSDIMCEGRRSLFYCCIAGHVLCVAAMIHTALSGMLYISDLCFAGFRGFCYFVWFSADLSGIFHQFRNQIFVCCFSFGVLRFRSFLTGFGPFMTFERSSRTVSIVRCFPCGIFGQHSRGLGFRKGFSNQFMNLTYETPLYTMAVSTH